MELPYQVEYAKSGRAGCKGCMEKIHKGALRIAVMVQSKFHDDKQLNWHHEECFFRKLRPKTINDFGKLNSLRHPDQKRIREAVERSMSVKKGNGKGKAAKRANGDSNAAALRDFAIEYSKSIAACRICEIKICKDEVCVSKTVYDTEIGQNDGGQALWHHVKCFAEDRKKLMFLAGGDDLPGFKSLRKEDKKMVKNAIKPLKSDEIPVKKLKAEPKDEQELKEEDLQKKLKKQNKLYFKYRDALRSHPKKELQELLEYNRQEVGQGHDEALNRLADCMAFGALEPCGVCREGQLVLETYGYKCTGYISEWTKCMAVTQKPERKPFIIPECSAFTEYKPKVGERIFETAPPPQILENGVKERPIPPLRNLQFFLYGKLSSNEEVKHRILKLGGLVVSELTGTTAAVVSTKEDVQEMPTNMQEIREKDIEVVEESFFDLIDPEKGTITNSLNLIKQNNIANWGSLPSKRLPKDVLDGKSIPRSGSLHEFSNSVVTKLKIKGGTAVDPASGLEDVAHVYRDWGGKYTAVLVKTDVVAKKNSYYNLQLLEADRKELYWLFRSWGRIGTPIGGRKLVSCTDLETAKRLFEEVYKEKTDIEWEFRDNFMKMAGRYYPVDVEYGGDDDARLQPEDAACRLPMPVQDLVVKIFDINLMKQTMIEFELDTEKMPLGKLSEKQIKAGYEVLSDLLKHIENGQADNVKIADATNSFYSLIPHDFGVNNPPLINSQEMIKDKAKMLDSLLEIEIAYGLLKAYSEERSPIEAYYLKLKSEIIPLSRESAEFAMLMKYVRNTHAATHAHYTLEVEQVFKVVRENDENRKPFKKLHNRKLLWHGSRVTNFAGILSQGLRIAPPEAPANGYMFGKGIYLADMVSKSANYCATSRANPVGVMALCEVALGDMKECRRAEPVKQLPAGRHSVWARGRTMPDPGQDLELHDGTVVPLGTPVHLDIDTRLLYNEFIVYDVAQVNVKYLFQMKFNYK